MGPGLIPIPDNGAIETTNVISGLGSVGVAKVRVNITHPFRGDLELTLVHPDGTQVRLKDANVNDDGADWTATYSTTDGSGTALAALIGKPIDGAWRLRVRDSLRAGRRRAQQLEPRRRTRAGLLGRGRRLHLHQSDHGHIHRAARTRRLHL
jgi:subtilisin-like proprotein convertase family protein